MSVDCAQDERKGQLECFRVLREALEHVRAEATVPLPATGSTTALSFIGAFLEKEVVKFSLFVGNDKELSTLVPVCEKFAREVDASVCFLRSLMSKACATWRAQIARAATSLLDAVLVLTAHLEKVVLSPALTLDPKVAGVAIERCKQVAQLAASNESAVTRHVKQAMAAIKDAKAEVEAFRCEGKDGAAQSVSDSMAFDDADFDDFDDDNVLTPASFARVGPAKQLCLLSYQTCRKAMQFLAVEAKQGGAQAEEEAAAEVCERLRLHCSALAATTDQLCSSLYEPQDTAEIKKALAAFHDTVPCILSLLASDTARLRGTFAPPAAATIDAVWLSRCAEGFTHALSALAVPEEQDDWVSQFQKFKI